jgi:hypothetical protein
MSSNRPHDRSRRTGAAFLLLVVMVLLVVVGATQTLVRSELTTRRGEAGRLRVRSMLAAIEATQQFGGDLAGPISLPIDVSQGETIEVTIHEEESHIIARWMKGDLVIDEMKQVLNAKAESKE